MITPTQQICPESNRYNKCPYPMTAEAITVHNTANDASAENEITYMNRNTKLVSFHFAVDDREVRQGLPLDRNAFHAGDGAYGRGNRKTIAVEVCYSKSGGERFVQAEKNAARFVAQLLKERGWGVDKVTKHQDYSGKYCPHRTLDTGWNRFLDMVKTELGKSDIILQPDEPASNKLAQALGKKTNEQIADEVILGRWGNGAERIERLRNAGYDYNAIQGVVNARFGKPAIPAKKSNETIANEVIAGKWGNNQDRKTRLTAAGYDYTAVQRIVNARFGKNTTPTVKTNEQIAAEVIAGKWGNGQDRKDRLFRAGYNYNAVQSIVNKKLGK